MDQAGPRTRHQRALRHAAPERVRELLEAYRRRAARDVATVMHSSRNAPRPQPSRAVGQRSSGSPAASAGSGSPSPTVSSAGKPQREQRRMRSTARTGRSVS